MTKRKRNRKSSRGGKGAPAAAAKAPAAAANAAEAAPGKATAATAPAPAKAPKAPKAPRQADRAAPAPRPALLGVVVGLAVVGVLLTGYLTATRWLDAPPAYCGADSDCDLVQSSRYSTLLGMPLSLLGMLTYVAIGAFAWRARRRPAAWRAAMFVAAVGVAISLYLTALSVFVIEATCAYCLASTVLICAILGLLATQRPAGLPDFRWAVWAPSTAITAAIVVGGLHMHYEGVFDPAAGPEKPYLKALALHLGESGAKFYGAYWCPRCQEQKELFEASADRLPYVECTPGGRNGPQAAVCAALDIRSYPTWIIRGERYRGKIEPGTLARHSDFRWDGPVR